eukprot:1685884-Pleurochrysis_carterae.AAC.2
MTVSEFSSAKTTNFRRDAREMKFRSSVLKIRLPRAARSNIRATCRAEFHYAQSELIFFELVANVRGAVGSWSSFKTTMAAPRRRAATRIAAAQRMSTLGPCCRALLQHSR